jgi:hypothetical protein
MSGAAGRPAEVLRKGSGIRVDGQQAMGSRSAYILRMPGICPGKRPPGPDFHQRAQSNDFWLRAATRTIFLTIRDRQSIWREALLTTMPFSGKCQSAEW